MPKKIAAKPRASVSVILLFMLCCGGGGCFYFLLSLTTLRRRCWKTLTSALFFFQIFSLPFELCRDVVRSIAFCVLYRPAFSLFVCTSITVLYLILSSQKVQQTLASLPYERFIAHFKSQKMITVYATVVEVVLELLMAVVLAGVSVIITMWLVFEEMTDRKNFKLSAEDKLTPRQSEFSVYRQSPFAAKSLNFNLKQVEKEL